MTDHRFQVLGSTIPPLIGRTALLAQIVGAISKPRPDHKMVVGPRFSGKSVLLQATELQVRKVPATFAGVVNWDLGHQGAADDKAFLRILAAKVSEELKQTKPECSEYLKDSTTDAYDGLRDVANELANGNRKLLFIFDGFDKALASSKLSRNLWDQLRELASIDSVCIVTASRRPLRELVKDPDAQTSDFWNIFGVQPVEIKCFTKGEIEEIAAEHPDIGISGGNLTEFAKSTRGFPLFVFETLNEIIKGKQPTGVELDHVRKAVENAYTNLQPCIDQLWRDCSKEQQDLALRLNNGETLLIRIRHDADALAAKGFAIITGEKLEQPSRFLQLYLKDSGGSHDAITRLFGNADAYETNLSLVFAQRIGQLHKIDKRLQKSLQRACADLHDSPNDYFATIREFCNTCFNLIWSAELSNGAIPSEWFQVWQTNGERFPDGWRSRLPDGGHRLHLLKLMLGTEKSETVAKHISKAVGILLPYAHDFGNYGQHRGRSDITIHIAYTALQTCIELAATLGRELPR